ncbi:MAG: hypothetical protein ACJAQ4_002749 [Cryomorphaceae bacterium]|jgi:hypothetical protein
MDQFDFILLDGLSISNDLQLTKKEMTMRHLMANVHSGCKMVFCFVDHGYSISNIRENMF